MVKSRKKEDIDVTDIDKKAAQGKTPVADEDAGNVDTAEDRELSPESGKDTGYAGPELREKNRRVMDRRGKLDKEIKNEKIENMKKLFSEKDEEIAGLKAEVENLKDQMLRRQADFENYKKRAARLHEDQKKFIIRDMALDIIMVNDDLLRAIEASPTVRENGTCDESHKSFVEGVSLISRQLEDALGKYGVLEIESRNVYFDPNLHEAVEIEMNNSVEKDTVTHVYQKGFKIDDLIVRSSRVKVAKPVPIKTDESSEGEADDDSGETPDA